ncbi:MAG TPA: cysteine desulfurase family protein [Candidatus Saccharimonadales bacterium]
MSKKSITYLDYAAATPVDEQVLKAMQPYFAEQFYNPAATYGPAREVRQALTAARARTAHWLGARPSEIIFTAGGTEANNLAIHGVMRQFPGANIVVSSIEHESVLRPAQDYDCREVAVQPDGRIDLEDLRRQIDDDTVLVSLMYANNEIGTVQPIREAAKIIAEKRQQRASAQPLYFHTDACQAANYLDLHVARLGIDLMTINGGKLYGPKQSGLLYVKAGLQLLPLIEGGGQERNMRSGTENVAAIIGLAHALELAQTGRHQETKRLQALQQQFFEELEKAIPAAVINGSRRYRLPNNIHITLPGQDNERLLIQLEAAGILAAAGSACSAASTEPSHVLGALGLSDDEARASVRFTMGRTTDAAAIQTAVTTLARLIDRTV